MPEDALPETPRPTLALCIPAYNAAWCLPRLLGSAAAQTVPFDEILVYDDGSTDDTAAVAEALGARVVRGDVNVGCSAGKNRLADAATSDWVHFHDADDDLLPTFVETVRRWTTREDGPDVVLLYYEYRNAETEEFLGGPDFDAAFLRQDPVEFVLRNKVVNFGLYRRVPFLAAGGFDLDPNVLFNEDAALHQRLALAGLRFDFEPELTCVNYRYGVSMSASNQRKCSLARYHVLKKAAEQAPPRHRPAIAEALWQAAGVSGSHLDWPTSDAAVALARELAGPRPPETAGSSSFRTFAALAPRAALRLREQAVRRLRPHLRAGSNG